VSVVTFVVVKFKVIMLHYPIGVKSLLFYVNPATRGGDKILGFPKGASNPFAIFE